MSDLYYAQFFTRRSVDALITTLSKYYPILDKEKLKKLIYDSQWENQWIRQKVRHVTECMHKVLPDSFDETVEILLKAAPEVSGWWEGMTLPDYIELYGQNFWDKSMSALVEFTKYTSAEFAIRPFLINQPEKTTAFLECLTSDDNENVRRYVSEGCRPRHPWGMALPLFKKDPSLILPILEKLKNDESESVRRSVANNLNDISKDNPETVLEIAEKWYGQSPNTDWLVKHACRTLLKNGSRRALKLFGFESTKNLIVSNFQLNKKSITLGEKITLTYSLDVKTDKETKVRLEYGVYFMKANGQLRRKVWRIAEKSYQPGSYMISKNHKFVDSPTKKHYQGTHCISIIVNGEEKEKLEFMLKI